MNLLVYIAIGCVLAQDAAASFCRANYEVASCGDCAYFLNDTSRELTRQCLANPDLSTCTSLSFQDLHIWNLEKGLLDGMNNLETLDLSLNQLKSLREDEFKDLVNLRTLRLDHNQLHTLPTTIFNQTTGLQELYLDNNFFEFLDEKLFQNFTALSTLHLHHNMLSQGGTSLRTILNTVPTMQDFTVARNGFSCIDTPYPIETTDINECFILLGQCGNPPLCRFHRDFFNGQLVRLGNCSNAILKGCTEIELVNKGIRSLRSGLLDGMSELTTLNLEDNEITSGGMPVNVFQDLSKLLQLYLGGNRLTSISKSLIAPLGALLDFEAQNNMISALPDRLFDANVVLQIVILSGNRLTRVGLRPAAFQGTEFLQKLYLDNNNIESLQNGLFAGLWTLQDLHLNNNALASNGLPSGVFSDLSNLEQLHLDGNNIATLPAAALDSMPILKQLYLSDNPLSTLDANLLASLPDLRELLVANARITEIAPGLLGPLVDLESLDLSGNQLSTLPADTFATNTKLLQISLVGNGIATWPGGLFDGLTSLVDVNVDGNPVGCFPVIARYFSPRDVEALCVQEIRTCGGCTFQLEFASKTLLRSGAACPAPTCNTLNLQIQGLTSLSAGVLHGMTGLLTLRLDANDITALDPDAFRDLTLLSTLRLDDNRLTTLPPTLLSGLENLAVLRLDNNLLASLPDGIFASLLNAAELSLASNRLADTSVSSSLFANVSRAAAIALGGQESDAVSCAPLGLEQTGSVDIPLCQALVGSCGACRLIVAFTTGELYRERECTAADISTGDCTTLDLQGKGIASLASGVFDGFAPLETLRLQSNSLSVIGAADLSSLVALRDLDVSGNALTEIHDTAFDSLTQLTRLAVADNALPALPQAAYDLPALTDLEMGGNGIACAEVLDAWGGTVDVPRCSQELLVCGACTFVRGRFDGVLRRTGDCSSAEVSQCPGRQVSLPSRFIASLSPGVFAGMTEIVTLNLRDNALTSLPNGIFADLVRVTNAFLDNNAIAEVSQQTFAGLELVRTLQLGFNRISVIRSRSFAGFSALRTLQLEGNRIASFEECALCGLDAVTNLFLEENQITQLPPALLAPLVQVQTLHLKRNLLQRVDELAFAGLGSLTTLELNDNQLTSVPAGIFAGLTSLSSLDLSSNPLASLPAAVFRGLTSLALLRVGYSNLVALPSSIFQGLTALKSLFLERSSLASFPAGVLDDLTALTRLDAFECALTQLPPNLFARCPNLVRIDLKLNQLSALPPGTFDQQSKLTALDLRGNRLTALPDAIFNATTALATLDLDSNGLALLPLAVFETTSELSVVSIDGNAIACAPIPSRHGVTYKETCNANTAPCCNFPLCPLLFDPCAGCEFYTDFFDGELFFQGNCVPADCIALNLRDRGITGIRAGALDAFVNVETIDMGHNQIDESDLGALGLPTKPNLKALLLNDNLIRTIPDGLLSTAWNLETLDVQRNRITSIDAAHLFCTNSLTHLLLSHNRLRTLPVGVFDRSYKLETLNVSHNLLTIAPKITFGWVHWHLQILNVSFNDLETVAQDTFSGLCVLDKLHINDNRILDLGEAPLTQDMKSLTTFDVRNNLLAGFDEEVRTNLISLVSWLDSGNPFGPLPPLFSVAAHDTLNGTDPAPIYAGLAVVTLRRSTRFNLAFDLSAGTTPGPVTCVGSRSNAITFIIIETSVLTAQSCNGITRGRRDSEVYRIDQSFHITRPTLTIDTTITDTMDASLLAPLANYFSIFEYQVLVSSSADRRQLSRFEIDSASDMVVGTRGYRTPRRQLLAETVSLTLIASSPAEYTRLLAMLNGLSQQGLTDLIKQLLGIQDPTTTTPPPPPPSGGGGGGGGGGAILPPPPETTPAPIEPAPSPLPQAVVDEGGGWSEEAVISLSVGLAALFLLAAIALMARNRFRTQNGKPYGTTRAETKAAQPVRYFPAPANAYGTNPYAYLASPQSPYTASPYPSHLSSPLHPDYSALYASSAPRAATLSPGNDASGNRDRGLYQTQQSGPGALYQSQQSIPPSGLYQSQQSIPPTAGLDLGTFSPFSSPAKSMASPVAPYRTDNLNNSANGGGSTRADLLYKQAF